MVRPTRSKHSVTSDVQARFKPDTVSTLDNAKEAQHDLLMTSDFDHSHDRDKQSSLLNVFTLFNNCQLFQEECTPYAYSSQNSRPRFRRSGIQQAHLSFKPASYLSIIGDGSRSWPYMLCTVRWGTACKAQTISTLIFLELAAQFRSSDPRIRSDPGR